MCGNAPPQAAHHGEWVTPVSTTYRGGTRVFELPPNPQGIAALQMLNILEHFNLTEMVPAPRTLHQHPAPRTSTQHPAPAPAPGTDRIPPVPAGASRCQHPLTEAFAARQGFNSADYLHVHIEAKKLAFADRAKSCAGRPHA